MGKLFSRSTKPGEDDMQRKIVVVGDGSVGKTCLIYRYMEDRFDHITAQEYIPTALDVKNKKVELKNRKEVDLLIYDTGGQETFEHLRKLNYPKSDAAIICFSIDSPSSFSNLEEMWIPEMKKMCPGIPLILVGNKRDLRDEAASPDGFVREGKGLSMAKKHKLVGYIECSSLTGDNVEKVFMTIIPRAVTRKVKNKRSSSADLSM